MANFLPYNINSVLDGVNSFGVIATAKNWTVTLAAATAASLAIPGSSTDLPKSRQKYVAIFSYHAARNVYVAVNATAAVPAGATLAASTSRLLPPAIVVTCDDTISIICATAATDVSITLYTID